MSYEVTVIVTEINDDTEYPVERAEVTRAVVRDHERADAERRAIALLGGERGPAHQPQWSPHPRKASIDSTERLANAVRENISRRKADPERAREEDSLVGIEPNLDYRDATREREAQDRAERFADGDLCQPGHVSDKAFDRWSSR